MHALKFNSFPTRWVIQQDVEISRSAGASYPMLADGRRISFVEAIKKALAKRNIAAKTTGANIVSHAPNIEIVSQRPKTLDTTPRFAPPAIFETDKERAKRVKRELIKSGVTVYGLFKAESKILPKIIHASESIMAVIYGRRQSSSIMLVATDKRIISLDKKPMVLLMDEFSYEVIAGLEFEIHTIYATLILHTPVKKYDIRFVNLRCADRFVRYVETQRIKSITKEEEKDTSELPPAIESPLVLYPRHGASSGIAPWPEIEKESEDETYYSPLNG
jgi:hypothetical protein